jgi:hypothetical protein
MYVLIDDRVIRRPRDDHRLLKLNFDLIGGILVKLKIGRTLR